MDIEDVAREIVDSAIKVHRILGPGLLESTYQKCLKHELSRRGVFVQTDLNSCSVETGGFEAKLGVSNSWFLQNMSLELPIIYEGVIIDAGYRIDMLAEHCVIVENKAVERLLPIHEAQILTYMKLRDLRLGFLLNWNVPLLKHGIRRMVNLLNRDGAKG